MPLAEIRAIKSGKHRADREQEKREKAAAKKKEMRKPLPKGKPLQKGARSEKMKGVMAAIKPLYIDFLEKRPVCEINSPVCTQTATCVHHTAGRGVAQVMNIKSWKASCVACNIYVEKHDEWGPAEWPQGFSAYQVIKFLKNRNWNKCSKKPKSSQTTETSSSGKMNSRMASARNS